MRIILIHGYKANPESNFWPWLKDELRKKGHDVILPHVTNTEELDAEAWTKAVLEEAKFVDDETIIVGHSLGGAVALRFLEAAEARSTPRGVVLISTPWMIKNPDYQGFFMSELDFDVLPWKASLFTVIHSKDDQVIPFDHAQKYAKLLRAKLVEVDACGHFKENQYPVILDEILSMINEEIVFAPGKSLDDEFADLQMR